MAEATFRILRGSGSDVALQDYKTEVSEGMVVLDAVHQIQAEQAGDLAVRWNCKAGKCGSCSAEVNGSPKLMCMIRLDDLPLADRATLGNMSPEFGSTCAIFPIDGETLRYLKLSGRSADHIELIEAYAKEQDNIKRNYWRS